MTLNLLFLTVTISKRTQTVDEYLHYEQIHKRLEEQKVRQLLNTYL
ncbi:YrzI family small protein [Sutcliffiella cohnii]|nr:MULTISPECIES: YrzI family small protein [Sutcliffiella]MED4016441.1 YrzI family small protein [Sutcliffiella cohnii]WBL13907.1 YrzI family small protein [Sutcliffiella sp. NC1]